MRRAAAMAVLAALASLAATAAARGAAPDPDRGLYAVWLRPGQKAFDLPFIKGGQAVVQWAEVETAEGAYDFSPLDGQLKAFRDIGRKATVQVNGNLKPAWLFDKVAVLPHPSSVQVRDRQGALQYWDPIFVKAYRDFVRAFGRHLCQSPLRDACLGVRLNYNAIGTEHGALAGEEREASRWKPAPDGHIDPRPWSARIWSDYRSTILAAFIEAFPPPMRLLARNHGMADEDAGAGVAELLKKGRLGLFHTSSEAEPRRGVERQYEAFLKYCRTGETIGYAEPWADSEGRHGGKKDVHTCTPCQWNYWRLLLDLHAGVSCIAIYGADLARAGDAEFRAALEWAARYAGFHASPADSPGAWVAFREGANLKGDYTFLACGVGEDGTRPVTGAGPADQRFGAWAREVPPGQSLGVRLDPAFAASIAGKAGRIRVVYLDEGAGPLTVAWDDGGGPQSRAVARTNSERWREAVVDVPSCGFGGRLAGADVRLSGEGKAVFHMVEVQRRPGRP